mmetsp:Transcript_17014/g.37463  ORF Transcript_17014/g.37463 Transcript_17014/m.37463 type:complete len:283 (+) Transcript_17014:1-849(+)
MAAEAGVISVLEPAMRSLAENALKETEDALLEAHDLLRNETHEREALEDKLQELQKATGAEAASLRQLAAESTTAACLARAEICTMNDASNEEVAFIPAPKHLKDADVQVEIAVVAPVAGGQAPAASVQRPQTAPAAPAAPSRQHSAGHTLFRQQLEAKQSQIDALSLQLKQAQAAIELDKQLMTPRRQDIAAALRRVADLERQLSTLRVSTRRDLRRSLTHVKKDVNSALGAKYEEIKSGTGGDESIRPQLGLMLIDVWGSLEAIFQTHCRTTGSPRLRSR